MDRRIPYGWFIWEEGYPSKGHWVHHPDLGSGLFVIFDVCLTVGLYFSQIPCPQDGQPRPESWGPDLFLLLFISCLRWNQSSSRTKAGRGLWKRFFSPRLLPDWLTQQNAHNEHSRTYKCSAARHVVPWDRSWATRKWALEKSSRGPGCRTELWGSGGAWVKLHFRSWKKESIASLHFLSFPGCHNYLPPKRKLCP